MCQDNLNLSMIAQGPCDRLSLNLPILAPCVRARVKKRAIFGHTKILLDVFDGQERRGWLCGSKIHLLEWKLEFFEIMGVEDRKR